MKTNQEVIKELEKKILSAIEKELDDKRYFSHEKTGMRLVHIIVRRIVDEEIKKIEDQEVKNENR